MAAKPATIDEYLDRVRGDKREALEKLRKTIRAAAPKAEECISYQLPAFRLNGPLVAFGATAKHCAFYLMSSSAVEAHREELAGYDTSKGTIRFQPEEPLPATLVRKLVKARIAENEALRGGATEAPARTRSAVPRPDASRTDPAVDALMRELDHPLKREIEEVRRIILGVSPAIGEAVKWNAPSFRTTEFFATVHLRSRDRVGIVLHLGAKVRKSGPKELSIPDPEGLLRWLAPDRCMVDAGAGAEFKARRGALEQIIRAWIGYL